MKKLLIVSIMFLCFSYSKKEFIVSIEQPYEKKLDGLKLEIFLDKKKVKETNLKANNIMPSYETFDMYTSNEGKHLLEVKLKDTVFGYDVKYPEEKYIIVGPYLKKNGKIQMGILKQKEGFIFH
ncbi:hypothetical protein ACFFLS_23845 [Flavobacterium procerum]|uniref:Uncharacterized protein n=1 Tax=Flavobacterium procerum TaxID=1455569 RepID=A0ABV6BYJ3_9FLAO